MYNKLINALGWVGCTIIPQIYKFISLKKPEI